jgi:3-hydroxyacyl-CoA dehydrogenase/enoyl-CoA hydratase/3-hydroxybutyryl-CoA epimerase
MSDSPIRWERDEDGVVLLTLDDPTQSVNTMNATFRAALTQTVERLVAERDAITGVVLRSAKDTFFAGGDLKELRAATREHTAELVAHVNQVKSALRQLETLGRPVVAAINGAALGGGLELALATHHRIVVDSPKAVVAFPEVQLGLLPGGGGVVRSVRLLGLGQALMGVLLKGQRLRPAQALELGLVDDIVSDAGALLPAARAWIAANPEAVQRWDVDGYKIPGGTPSTPSLAAMLPAFPANLRKQIKGANYPAPHHILAAAVEGAQVDVESALRIETRYFVDLATGQVAKNMIQAFFFDLQQVNGQGQGEGGAPFSPDRVVVLGAGMMGAGIAYVCAKAGMEVVLKDVSQEAAEHGKAYSQGLVEKAVARGRSTQEQADALLARITPSTDAAAADGAELVIEAVFEDPAIKDAAFKEIESHLAPDALLGSNTSSLPITELSAAVTRPADFIGLHFFSPVDKMPLLEIVRGQATGDAAVGRALDLARRIGKTPIIVGDSRGFFTSRVIATFLNEGIMMLLEGIPAPTIEQASAQAGYPAPVLQLSDELSMELMVRVRNAGRAAAEAAGGTWEDHPAYRVMERMVAEGRPGRAKGAGFFEYRDGKRAGLWPGLRELFAPIGDPSSIALRDLEERMLFIEALESVRCLQEGVITSVAGANIGSILGIGYPGWTGGVLQYINGYDGGPAGFVARARQLAVAYGPRFDPPASLVELAQRGERYSDEPAPVPA